MQIENSCRGKDEENDANPNGCKRKWKIVVHRMLRRRRLAEKLVAPGAMIA
jgi:hypothetical protein